MNQYDLDPKAETWMDIVDKTIVLHDKLIKFCSITPTNEVTCQYKTDNNKVSTFHIPLQIAISMYNSTL